MSMSTAEGTHVHITEDGTVESFDQHRTEKHKKCCLQTN